MPAYVEADSYTTIARVQALVARGVFSSSTIPTQQQVYDFMALDAGEVTARVAQEGVAITTATRLDGSNAMVLADQANMYLAAADALFAHESKDGAPSERVQALWSRGQEVLEALASTVSAASGTGAGVRSSTATGGIVKDAFSSGSTREEFPHTDLFDLNTRN
jgi:hypothetical protein